MTSLNLQFAPVRPSTFIPLLTPSGAPAPVVTEPALEASAPPVLPPAPEPFSLNRWRGQEASDVGERAEIREHISSTAMELVIDLDLPGFESGDHGHLAFYQAVATHIWHHCPKAVLGSKDGRMAIDRPDALSRQAVDKALHEIETLLAFLHQIGGDLTQLCRLIHAHPQLVEDLDAVFGDVPRRFFAAAGDDDREENSRDHNAEVVLRLSNGIAAAGRPDLQLALLDVALPNCRDAPAKATLCEQWLALNNAALEQEAEPPASKQQGAVLKALLRSPPKDLAPDRLAALAGLAGHVESRDEQGRTPLRVACRSGDIAAVRNLIAIGADIESRDDRRWTPLISACKEGHATVVELLLAKGANIRSQDADGITALMYACQQGHAEEARLLLDSNANIESGDKDGWTPLIWACCQGHAKVVRLLLYRKAMIEGQAKSGWTPLMFASEGGHLEVVRLLLDNNAKIDSQDKDGLTALMLACRFGRAAVARLLLAHEADIESQER